MKFAPRWIWPSLLLMLLVTPLVAQPLQLQIQQQTDLDYEQPIYTGASSQPVTHPTVAKFKVRARRHNTLNRTLDLDITLPTIPLVTQWNVAYSIDSDSPSTSTVTTSTFTLNVPPRNVSSGNRMEVFVYIYIDANFGGGVAEYNDQVLLSAILSEI